MTMSPRETADQRARQRFLIMNAARFSGLVLVLLGIAITRGTVALPWAVGAVLAVIGLLEFFFVPLIIAKRWKAGDEQLR